jgi:hypothetical protein
VAGERPQVRPGQGAPARRAGSGFGGAVVWSVVWIASMIVAAGLMVGTMRRGDWGPVPILGLWLGFAGYALWRVGRGIVHRAGGPPPPVPPVPRGRRGREHVWHDDLAGRGER